MSEYMEKHSVSRLIGAPPGYVGYDGRLTDGQGRVVNFKNTVILMTSNLGSSIIQDIDDRKRIQDEIQQLLKAHFKPEFLNRIDEIVIFNKLGEKDILRIVDLEIDELERRLAEKTIKLTVSDDARRALAKDGFDPAFGARPLKRLIQKSLYNEIASGLLKGSIKESDSLRVDYDAKGNKFIRFPSKVRHIKIEGFYGKGSLQRLVCRPA